MSLLLVYLLDLIYKEGLEDIEHPSQSEHKERYSCSRSFYGI